MRLKSFHGPNLTDAMRQVREALGDNAIIVATRDDDMGGVRVTAAIDEVPPGQPPAFAGKAVAGEFADGAEAVEIIADALTRHQVPAYIAERLVASAMQFANDDPVLALGAALDTHLDFQPVTDDTGGKPLIFIGPPGAGKTLCTAKFATRATLGKKPVTVVTTDLDRAGGMEQLAAFTRLLKINLLEIEDSHALKDMVAGQKGNPILIDTAGRNPFSEIERQQVHALVAASGGDAVLVMPAALDAGEAIDMAQEFRTLGATRLIATRMEMTRRLGCFLRTAFEARLPLANYSASSKVTEPPQPFNPVALARMILSSQGAAFSIQGDDPENPPHQARKSAL
ncbi:MAG TPA: GTPase [Alphaproteobacteria bacterium]|nr:GTPase [Alphaproteobacteria bacterium]